MISTLILMLTLGSSDAYVELYERGNEAYKRGDFVSAASAYEQLASSGVWNAALYFNLGNTYFQQQDFGRAILNFERAAGIDPDFQLASRNLALAVSATTHKLGRPDGFSLVPYRPSWLPGLSQPVLCGWLLAFWCLLWGIIIHRQQRVNSARAVSIVLWVFVILLGLTLAIPAPFIRSAVVVVSESPLRYGPDPRDTVRTTLASGDRLLVDRIDGDWARVETATGERGWLDRKGLALVGPPFAPVQTEREQ